MSDRTVSDRALVTFADPKRDSTTLWDGVSNPVALRHLSAMKPGDRLVIYETGHRKSALDTARVLSVDASHRKNPKVEIKAIRGVSALGFSAGGSAAASFVSPKDDSGSLQKPSPKPGSFGRRLWCWGWRNRTRRASKHDPGFHFDRLLIL